MGTKVRTRSRSSVARGRGTAIPSISLIMNLESYQISLLLAMRLLCGAPREARHGHRPRRAEPDRLQPSCFPPRRRSRRHARSDLAVPDQIARMLSLYPTMSIGFRGGIEIAHHGVDPPPARRPGRRRRLSFLIPFAAEPVSARSVAARPGGAIAAGRRPLSARSRPSPLPPRPAPSRWSGCPDEGFMVAVGGRDGDAGDHRPA
jgi:hypothetical protein